MSERCNCVNDDEKIRKQMNSNEELEIQIFLALSILNFAHFYRHEDIRGVEELSNLVKQNAKHSEFIFIGKTFSCVVWMN